MALVNTSRGQFFIRDSGGDGTTVLMIHGWPETSACWEALMPLLSPDCRYIRPDTRGMGDSERTLEVDAYRKEALALDILAIMDSLDISQFVLIGHDWGGIIAQEIALAAPERVLALVLLNISLINNSYGNRLAKTALLENGGVRHLWYQFFQQQPQLAEAMIAGNERLWLSHFLRFAKGREFPVALLDEYERVFKIPFTATTSANYYRCMNDDMRRWASLSQPFAMPGFYIYGNKDVVIVPEYLEGIEACFENGVTRVDVEAGHFVQDELPGEVAAAMNQFLSRFINHPR